MLRGSAGSVGRPVINHRSPDTIDFPPRGRRPRRFGLLAFLARCLLLFVGGGTVLSYYVDALWFGSLGYGAGVLAHARARRRRSSRSPRRSRSACCSARFVALKPAGFGEIGDGGVIMINDRPGQGAGRSGADADRRRSSPAVIALGTAGGMAGEWPTIALWWYGRADRRRAAAPGHRADLRAAGRASTCSRCPSGSWPPAGCCSSRSSSSRSRCSSSSPGAARGSCAGTASPRTARPAGSRWPGRRCCWRIAARDLPRTLRAAVRRAPDLLRRHLHRRARHADRRAARRGRAGARRAGLRGDRRSSAPRVRWLDSLRPCPRSSSSSAPAPSASYVEGFIVKPNELVREQPFIAHNIELTRQAFGLDRIERRAFPAEPGGRRPPMRANNQATLQNIRLWDWRVLQDTLRQLQEIRTYYDFPDIDIDRYMIDGAMRQVMLATRELNVAKLPEGSRTWINEKLVYTHGYGLTMNVVNGFTPEGLPTLLLKDMPIQSALAGAQGDAAGDLLRRDDEHRRLRQDAPAGVQLPAGTDQQRDVVRGHRRHPAGRLRAAVPDCARSRRRRQAAVQRRHHGGEPAADAPQRPRARRGARAVPRARSRSLHRAARRRPAVVDDGRASRRRSTIRIRGRTGSATRAPTTSATASRWWSTPTTARPRSTSSIRRIRSSAPTGRCSRRCSRTPSAMPADLRAHVRYPRCCSRCRPRSTGCTT